MFDVTDFVQVDFGSSLVQMMLDTKRQGLFCVVDELQALPMVSS